MRMITCAGVVFHDASRVMLEDRRRISKHGEHWSFFGGVVEGKESVKAALTREIKEELSFTLRTVSFVGKYIFNPNGKLKLVYYMFSAPIPDPSKLRVQEKSGIGLWSFKQALRLKMTKVDKKIIKDVMRKTDASGGICKKG